MEKSSKHTKTETYGLWKSSYDIETLFSKQSIPSYPFRKNGVLYWLESLTEEDGRVALISQNGTNKVCLLPSPFNIRSKVHEYGGCCFCIIGSGIVFNNFSDGHLYFLNLNSHIHSEEPIRLTVHPKELFVVGYVDLVASPHEDCIIAVSELVTPSGSEDCLVAVAVNVNSPNKNLVQRISYGKNFYCCPDFDKNGKKIAWIEWDEKFMPWDQSRLCRARLNFQDEVFKLSHFEILIDQPDRSICQLGFLPDNSLLFASDSDTCNFWNLFRYQDNSDLRITDRLAEIGEAHWIFGQKRWKYIGNHIIVGIETTPKEDRIIRINLINYEIKVLHQTFAMCSHLSMSNGELLFVAKYQDRDPDIVSLETSSFQMKQVWKTHSDLNISKVSTAKLIRYPTRDDHYAFGYFYPPLNSCYVGTEGTLPPLIIFVHGGPTSRATIELSLLKQYFTSLGYALFDVNYRGSTGHGRCYRQKLLGEWGKMDVTDIIDGLGYIINEGLVNPKQVFIRGSSAGGYTVLRILTRYVNDFSGGACYYGIGNLMNLVKSTHRFEGKYTDRLIGETYHSDQIISDNRYVERSPVFNMDKLMSPIIFFQGLSDQVVPPDLTREVVDTLKKKSLIYEYIEYPEEGHGFRLIETKIDSLRKEIQFFSTIIRNMV